MATTNTNSTPNFWDGVWGNYTDATANDDTKRGVTARIIGIILIAVIIALVLYKRYKNVQAAKVKADNEALEQKRADRARALAAASQKPSISPAQALLQYQNRRMVTDAMFSENSPLSYS